MKRKAILFSPFNFERYLVAKNRNKFHCCIQILYRMLLQTKDDILSIYPDCSNELLAEMLKHFERSYSLLLKGHLKNCYYIMCVSDKESLKKIVPLNHS